MKKVICAFMLLMAPAGLRAVENEMNADTSGQYECRCGSDCRCMETNQCCPCVNRSNGDDNGGGCGGVCGKGVQCVACRDACERICCCHQQEDEA